MADRDVVETIGRLEGVSAQLLAYAQRDDIGVAESARAFAARSELDGHLLAARVLLSSGASVRAVSSVLRRASDAISGELVAQAP